MAQTERTVQEAPMARRSPSRPWRTSCPSRPVSDPAPAQHQAACRSSDKPPHPLRRSSRNSDMIAMFHPPSASPSASVRRHLTAATATVPFRQIYRRAISPNAYRPICRFRLRPNPSAPPTNPDANSPIPVPTHRPARRTHPLRPDPSTPPTTRDANSPISVPTHRHRRRIHPHPTRNPLASRSSRREILRRWTRRPSPLPSYATIFIIYRTPNKQRPAMRTQERRRQPS